ncbi:MAG: RNA polymerase sigma-70 factor [Bacteroidales bacterium]|nr:RNA polymerase sigma-70 factor [Bacteroidales bacterium]
MFKAYYRGLCFYAEGIVGEKEAAEEIVSDFFMKLWENHEIIHITTSLQAYLYKGIYNNSLKYLEHIKVLNKYRGYGRYMATNHDLFQPQADQPLSMLISRETVAEIENAIDALPAQCKEVFSLARLEGLSYQEIAEKLDISINTVRTQITRAMTKLRESLGKLIKN